MAAVIRNFWFFWLWSYRRSFPLYVWEVAAVSGGISLEVSVIPGWGRTDEARCIEDIFLSVFGLCH